MTKKHEEQTYALACGLGVGGGLGIVGLVGLYYLGNYFYNKFQEYELNVLKAKLFDANHNVNVFFQNVNQYEHMLRLDIPNQGFQQALRENAQQLFNAHRKALDLTEQVEHLQHRLNINDPEHMLSTQHIRNEIVSQMMDHQLHGMEYQAPPQIEESHEHLNIRFFEI